MTRLIYSAITSLDGYHEDQDGSFDWAEPDDEVFAFITDHERKIGTYLFGRRMYETMLVWETDPSFAAGSDLMADFANIWQAADKVVYSTTLESVSTARTRIERSFDADAVRKLKASASSDLSMGGSELASHAFAAGLVDECHLFLVPAIVGAGKRALPDEVRMDLELVDERRFDNGTVYVRYRVRG